jgi:type I restriction enzyme, S subunit
MSLAGYVRYKDSGIEWLGHVPEHWTIAPLRQATSQIQTGPFGSQLHSEDYVENGVPVINPSNIVNGCVVANPEATVDDATAHRLGHHRLRPGDIVFGRRGEMGRCAVVSLAHEGWLCGTGSLIVRASKRALPSYLAAYFGTRGVREALTLASVGSTMDNLNEQILARLQVPLPSVEEQTTIVAFLDRETTKIDALVEEQRRLIELLKKKRQAVVSHAVTKGLDPHAPMKDSGVEWLGRVPEHWEVRCIGRLFSEVAEEGLHELPVLSVSIHDGVSDRELNDEDADRKITRSEDRTKYRRVQPNDLVYNMMRAWQGGFGTVQVEGMVSPAYVVARPRSTIHTRFVEHLLRTPQAVEEMRRRSHGVTDFRLRLYWDEFKDIRLAIPPVREQQEILAFIVQEDVRINELIATAEISIRLLQERRTALISAAVTGKIDVRPAKTRADALVHPTSNERPMVAAEIIERLSGKPTFGRVKLQKIVYLTETYANVNELKGNYLREAAGPLDRGMIEEMETRLRSDGVVSVDQPSGKGGTVTYRVKRRGAYRQEAAALLGSRAAGLTRLIDLLGDLDTKKVEAIATIYAVWNDALLDGITPTDEFIVNAFLKEWHPEKAKKFKPADLRKWLDWMRQHQLTPNGTGPRTVTGRLFP